MALNNKDIENSNLGATLVEFTLVIGLFAALAMTVVDFARIFGTRALLTRGAQHAAALSATVDDFEIDLALSSNAAGTDNTETAERRQSINNARVKIAQRATYLVSTRPTSEGLIEGIFGAKLVSYAPLDDVAGELVSGDSMPALILRPGDSATQNNGEAITHPDRCSASVASCELAKQRLSTDSQESLLSRYPILVEVRAVLPLYSPFLPRSMLVRGSAWSYRERALQGKLGDGAIGPEDIDGTGIDSPKWDPNDDSGPVTVICPEVLTCTPGSFWDENSCQCLSLGGT